MEDDQELERESTGVTSWPDPPPPPEPEQGIFMGRFGLRAGWGITIFIIVFALLATAAGFLSIAATGHLHEVIAARAQAHAHPGAPLPHVTVPFSPTLVTVQDAVSFFGILAMCWVFSKAERRRLPVYGIGSKRWTDLFPGAFWGLVAMSALVAVLRSMHVLVFDERALHGTAILMFGARWLLAFLLVGFMEEYAFRGYLQYTLMRGLWGLAERIAPVHTRAVAFWLAASLLSGLFAFAHTFNAGETPVGILQVFLAGITLSYGLWRTGSLWWSIGLHATWDWAQSFLFGVADSGNISLGRLFITHPAGNPILSGGPDGPEGSLIGVAALAFLVLVTHFTARPGTQPALEPEPRHALDAGVTHISIA